MEALGAVIWLKQPVKQPQRAAQPAAAGEAEEQRDTRPTSRQRRSAERLRAFQAKKRAAVVPAGSQIEPQVSTIVPEAGGAVAAAAEAATRASSTSSTTADVQRDGSTALVAAPQLTTASAVGVELMELSENGTVMEPSSSEPSESGEIPHEELSAEERMELKGGKEERGGSTRESHEAVQAWRVDRLKAELVRRGLSTNGRRHEMVARLIEAE